MIDFWGVESISSKTPTVYENAQHRIQRPGGEGARNMKSIWPPLAAIFFMTYLYKAGGGMAPSAPPGSATDAISMF